MTQLLLDYNLAYGRLHTAVFLQRGFERALRFHASENWSTDRHTLAEVVDSFGGDVLLHSRYGAREVVVLDFPQTVLMMELECCAGATPFVSIEIQAESRHLLDLELARVNEIVPPVEEPRSELISVGFWYWSANGARKLNRRLEAPGWTESSRNYPGQTRRAIEPSMTDVSAVISGGRLILWHGPPGTGKTSALRTLARENHEVLALEYVLDPDAFFGRDAGYFVNVLFSDDEEAAVDKTRLLVLEDCDELLSADAKERAGQGLARLLNLVDGLIGQGLKVGVLITTNEPLHGFHPAVSRPGRCGAIVCFELFSSAEAAAWLDGQSNAGQIPGPTTLADLYAMRDRREMPSQRQRIGFHNFSAPIGRVPS